MATTVLNTASQVSKWNREFQEGYVRGMRFEPYMGDVRGSAQSMPILINADLVSGGRTVNMPFIAPLMGDGRQGKETLTGNEEALANYNQAISVNYNRHAVQVDEADETWGVMDLRRAARGNLKKWATRRLSYDVVSAMLSFDTTSYVNGRDAVTLATGARRPGQVYAAYSEATKDAFVTANADRVLFGAAKSNTVAADHSASLLNVDAAADRMTVKIARLAKQLAMETAEGQHGINPFEVDDDAGREHFVAFLGNRAFRDLKADSEMQSANRDARIRGTEDNPLFQDGDLLLDGIIFRQIPDIPVLAGVGAAAADVEPFFLCGAGAVGVAWGQYISSHTKAEDDYQFLYGVGIRESRGVAKLMWNGIQHGMVTGYVAAPATA